MNWVSGIPDSQLGSQAMCVSRGFAACPRGYAFLFSQNCNLGRSPYNQLPCSHSSKVKCSRGMSQQHFWIESEELRYAINQELRKEAEILQRQQGKDLTSCKLSSL